MWLNIRTEYSFGSVFGKLAAVASKTEGFFFAGICDEAGTWGFVPWHKECTKKGITPILGVTLPVVSKYDAKERRCQRNNVSLIALDYEGLRTIYDLVTTSYDQFYYFPRLYPQQLPTGRVAVIGENLKYLTPDSAVWLTPSTPVKTRSQAEYPFVAGIDNHFVNPGDEFVYEPFADERKLERKTTPQHILSYSEWLSLFPGKEEALQRMLSLASCCKVELKQAEMVQYPDKINFEQHCRKWAQRKNIPLNDPVYGARFEKELKLIKLKGYTDYFLVVADVIGWAKNNSICVGPGRGSSSGSLICWILGITEIDPIKHNLVFERFIDLRRGGYFFTDAAEKEFENWMNLQKK